MNWGQSVHLWWGAVVVGVVNILFAEPDKENSIGVTNDGSFYG